MATTDAATSAPDDALYYAKRADEEESRQTYAGALDMAARLLYACGYAPLYPGVLVEYPMSMRAHMVDRLHVVRAPDTVLGFALVNEAEPDELFVYDAAQRGFLNTSGCWLSVNGKRIDVDSDPAEHPEFFWIHARLHDYLEAETPGAARKALRALHEATWPRGKRRHRSEAGPPAKRLRSAKGLYEA